MKCYNSVQSAYKADLHHYFRFTYRVIKFIHDEKSITPNEKYDFVSLYRSIFSPYELLFIFYNGLHPYGKEKLFPLLNEYSFFNNLDDTLLIHESHKKKYNEVAYGDWNGKTREQNLEAWHNKQKVNPEFE